MEDTEQKQAKEEEREGPKRNEAIPFLRANLSAEQLKPQDWEMPKFKEDEILIEVKSFGINFADVMARKGQYQAAPPFPFVPGYEVSGLIVAKGASVTNFEIGDRVAALTAFGGYARYAVARGYAAAKIPETWSFAQGASIPVSYLTAYYSLYQTGPVNQGDRVLIHACVGGLGQALAQLALVSGCEVYGTCGSDAKAKLALEKGMKHVINYKTADFEVEMKRLVPDGVDIIIDSIGGSYIKKDLNLLRASGRVVGVGAAAFTQRGFGKILSLIPQVLSMMTVSAIDLMLESKSFCGVNIKEIADRRPAALVGCWKKVMDLFNSGQLKLEKPTEYNWKDVGKALDDIEKRVTTGKIVINIPDK